MGPQDMAVVFEDEMPFDQRERQIPEIAQNRGEEGNDDDQIPVLEVEDARKDVEVEKGKEERISAKDGRSRDPANEEPFPRLFGRGFM